MGMTVTIVGASGLVGRELINQLVADPAFDVIHLVGRRALPVPQTGTDKLVQHTVDFSRLDAFTWPASELLFCCLGTTRKTAGSDAAFRAVDFDLIVDCARRAYQSGARRLVLISAMGANSRSPIFYNRVKGDTEQAVSAIGYDSVCIVRPSLLVGARTEFRAGEKALYAAMRIANPLLPRKYRSIPASAVAAAMGDAAKTCRSGIVILESDRLQTYA